MAVKRNLPSVRRSQLISTYGVGAIIPIESESFLIGGIDSWPTPRDQRAGQVVEPRLARLLGVQKFLAPPAGDRSSVPIFRFPELVFCPECTRLDWHNRLAEHGSNDCRDCGRALIPSRFVACCTNGHIQDFPYHQWVHRGQDPEGDGHRLSLEVRGSSSSLADIVIRCACGVRPVSMQNALGRGSLKAITQCAGKRPWLDSDDPWCGNPLAALQRGSSSVWHSVVRSSLSIPPWSEGAYAFATSNWDVLSGLLTNEEVLRVVVESLRNTDSPGIDEILGAIAALSSDDIAALDEATLRAQEYEALGSLRPEQATNQDFVCVPRDAPSAIAEFIDSVSEVARLREVRVLQSFTRVDGPAGDASTRNAPLSGKATNWLPAIEVLGEGVFIRLNEHRVQMWEASDFAHLRQRLVQSTVDRQAFEHGKPPALINARKLLIHSLAHVLVNELSLDTGYPASSIRERIYSAPGQAGILLYTATSDAAGSLGGLCAKAEPNDVERLVRDAIERSRWCSADPVCIESTSTGADALNLAACHSCLLIPEVSCEHQNTLLDRACLVGLPDDPSLGYFDGLVF